MFLGGWARPRRVQSKRPDPFAVVWIRELPFKAPKSKPILGLILKACTKPRSRPKIGPMPAGFQPPHNDWPSFLPKGESERGGRVRVRVLVHVNVGPQQLLTHQAAEGPQQPQQRHQQQQPRQLQAPTQLLLQTHRTGTCGSKKWYQFVGFWMDTKTKSFGTPALEF